VEGRRQVRILDESGREWRVFESASNGERYLYFDCADAFRRVRSFPEHWPELEAAALIALSWTT